MFSLQRLFSRDPKFFDLLEASARENCGCAKAVRELLRGMNSDAPLHAVRQVRRRSKSLYEQISELAVKTFVTVIDREDIEALAHALYRVPKPLEKFAEHLMIARDVLVEHQQFQKFQQVDIIEECMQIVLEMVQSLRRGIDGERISALNAKLQSAEAEADNLELELLKQLYHSGSPMQAHIARDLYALLEKVVDRCRDAGNVMLMICHKNS